MLSRLRNKLLPLERAAVSPLFDLPLVVVDPTSTLNETEAFIFTRFVAVEDSCCPFELHFGRGRNLNHFNFYVGLGAEFYNYEPLEDDDTAMDIASDLRRFLHSDIRVEQTIARNGEVLRADYFASDLSIDGSPVRLHYAVGWGLFRRPEKRESHYTPWLVKLDL